MLLRIVIIYYVRRDILVRPPLSSPVDSYGTVEPRTRRARNIYLRRGQVCRRRRLARTMPRRQYRSRRRYIHRQVVDDLFPSVVRAAGGRMGEGQET